MTMAPGLWQSNMGCPGATTRAAVNCGNVVPTLVGTRNGLKLIGLEVAFMVSELVVTLSGDSTSTATGSTFFVFLAAFSISLSSFFA